MAYSTQLGKYTLIQPLGEGGFGAVYLARETDGERRVAVKVMHPHLTRSSEMIERFRREYSLAARLQHPNILHMLDAGEQDGRYYLVMEYLDGEPLSTRLADGKPLTLEQAVEILEPLASALDYAHAQGMVHRDIKPSNVIIDRSGRPVLTDFGLVKLVTPDGSGVTTTTGETLGTVEYMSPERIQGLTLEPASDQYSLGVMAYQMLAGQAPFKGTSSFKVQQDHVMKPPPNPRIANPTLQPQAVPPLERALAKNPTRRYPCTMEFVTDLKNVVVSERQSRADALIQQARQAEQRQDFDAALAAIDDARRLSAGPEIERLFKTLLHKKTILQQVEQLRRNEEAVQADLQRIRSENPWLPQPEAVLAPAAPPARVVEPAKSLAPVWMAAIVKIALSLPLGHYSLITFLNLYTGYSYYNTKTYGVSIFLFFVLTAIALTLLLGGLTELSRLILSTVKKPNKDNA